MPWSYARGQDVMTVPWLDRVVAHGIPRARFELLEAAAHQPFRRTRTSLTPVIDTFWRDVDEGARAMEATGRRTPLARPTRGAPSKRGGGPRRPPMCHPDNRRLVAGDGAQRLRN